MSSSKDYLDFVLEQLSELDDITYRPMMGEYILYYKDKIIGGIYDNRFLIKPVDAIVKMLEGAKMEVPYDGAKPMLMVDDIDNKTFLKELIEKMYEVLPAPKKKR